MESLQNFMVKKNNNKNFVRQNNKSKILILINKLKLIK